MASQIQGFTVANILEVEANTRAARVTLRPEDVGALGAYSLASTNGATVMSAGLAANAPIFMWRWGNASNLALVKRVTFSAGNGVTAFTAGFAQFNLFAARSFSVDDTGGSSILPSGNQNKMRTSMGTTLLTGARISNTVTLTAGTRTKDANPLSTLVTGIPAVAGSKIYDAVAMFDQRPGEYPLVFAQNEGLVLEATVPATGVWSFGVKVDWLEVTAY